jgi:hypothetical protein
MITILISIAETKFSLFKVAVTTTSLTTCSGHVSGRILVFYAVPIYPAFPYSHQPEMLFWTSGYKVPTFNGIQKRAVRFAYHILPV